MCPLCVLYESLTPQQGKLMWSSAQNSSGVHWCRRRVRFNEVPEKVPKVPEKVWEALVQSQVTFNSNRVPEKVPEKVWEALVQRQVRFNRGSRSFSAQPRQVQQGSGEGSGEEPSQVQQSSGKGSGEGHRRLWCRARSGSTGFRRRFRRRSGRLWCRARSSSTGFAAI